MNRLFLEAVDSALLLGPVADAYNGDPDTACVSMRDQQRVAFLVQEGTGGVGTATFTVEACTTAGGAGATPIPCTYSVAQDGANWSAYNRTTAASPGVTSVAGAGKMLLLEVTAADVLSAVPGELRAFVRLAIEEVANDPVAACVTALFGYQSHS